VSRWRPTDEVRDTTLLRHCGECRRKGGIGFGAVGDAAQKRAKRLRLLCCRRPFTQPLP